MLIALTMKETKGLDVAYRKGSVDESGDGEADGGR